MGADAPAWTIEELGPHHDRSTFSCGHASLDDFLKQYATQNQKTGVSRTFVATLPNESIVRGYYSLAAGSVRFEVLTDDQRKRLPKYPVPVAHLGRLSVDKSVQGRGLGEHLLLDAFARIATVDRALGIHAVEVVAIDSAAKGFYVKYGFAELKDDPHHFFLSMIKIKKLGLLEGV